MTPRSWRPSTNRSVPTNPSGTSSFPTRPPGMIDPIPASVFPTSTRPPEKSGRSLPTPSRLRFSSSWSKSKSVMIRRIPTVPRRRHRIPRTTWTPSTHRSAPTNRSKTLFSPTKRSGTTGPIRGSEFHTSTRPPEKSARSLPSPGPPTSSRSSKKNPRRKSHRSHPLLPRKSNSKSNHLAKQNLKPLRHRPPRDPCHRRRPPRITTKPPTTATKKSSRPTPATTDRTS
mmetsp:Transcript_5621/g.14042  ORF Transcript_5621/g.14042 Transcript_5621/m.14042 type:complete len:228 (+) Transcript_5621:365-1048(+)